MQTLGPVVSIGDSDKSSAYFDLQDEGVYEFTHTVTDSTGLFDSDTMIVDASVLGINNIADLPKEYSLGNNYPNPFNPSTTIEYYVPVAGIVSLTVFDLHGRTVGVLIKEFQTAGSYTIDFNADDLPSGLYFLKMQAGDFKATSKMMYLK
ncbi:MAG: T9SS type A sorting domain-containing protein [Candidatus Marinimicrobia bacterium]|nr:T9SS type A sorting domain-containing protein [Candidatus Neomarinimicrobiota bacterium]